MRFWDTSEIIPLLVAELSSDVVMDAFSADSSIVVWWGTSIECLSAISRLEREQKITFREADTIISRLAELRSCWREIQPSNKVKELAERILRLHPLRAQDAQQLAACLVANSETAIALITLDERLEIAARREGIELALE